MFGSEGVEGVLSDAGVLGTGRGTLGKERVLSEDGGGVRPSIPTDLTRVLCPLLPALAQDTSLSGLGTSSWKSTVLRRTGEESLWLYSFQRERWRGRDLSPTEVRHDSGGRGTEREEPRWREVFRLSKEPSTGWERTEASCTVVMATQANPTVP